MEAAEFETAVFDILDDLPQDFASKLENVQVVVSDRPSPEELNAAHAGDHALLLGLYQGVPRPERGMNYMLMLPDKISIFKEPIEKVSGETGMPAAELIRRVVLHEIAHHFGIPDRRLRELGY